MVATIKRGLACAVMATIVLAITTMLFFVAGYRGQDPAGVLRISFIGAVIFTSLSAAGWWAADVLWHR